MRAVQIVLIVVAGAMLYVGSAQAQTQLGPVQDRQPHPGAAALAASANIVFMPVRVVLAAIGGELGGLTGWLTAGNKNAAHDIWGLPPFDGQVYLQPEMLYGQEPLMVGSLEYRMHVTKP
jgi:hypothetical protein